MLRNNQLFLYCRAEIDLSPTGVFPKPIECGSIYMVKEYESIHCRKGFLIKTNES